MRARAFVSYGASLILAAACATSASPSREADVVELTRLESVWNNAHVNHDAGALFDLWANELTVTVPHMQVITKDVGLNIIKASRVHFLKYDTTDLKVRPYGDAAVVTGRMHRAREMNGNVVTDDWNFTKTYVRRDGRWQVVAFAATDAAPAQ